MAQTLLSKQWRLAPPTPPEILEAFPDLPPLVVQLLHRRHLSNQTQVDEFLNPDYGQDLHDPFLFRQMEAACERVWLAIEAGEKVVIHGDYDADGVTGTSVLVSTFRAVAKITGGDPQKFQAYFPHREKDGYGVRPETVRRLAAEGVGLMIPVDCGIGNRAEVALAKELGMDCLVVDHHQVPPEIPECIILHPLVPGETYPYKSLAAVGVAFKFACGFIDYAQRHGAVLEPGFDKWLLDLVAIATVTDIMPLLGENRTLETYGLKVLNKTRRPGLKRLIEKAGLNLGSLDTMSVGFYIGPRINAASRMDHAQIAFDCLMAEDEETAEAKSEELNCCNVNRQKATELMFTAAHADVVAAGKLPVICVAGEGWSAGVVGIVAGRLTSEFGVPSFVFGKDGDRYVGSGRSIPGLNVIDAMNQASRYLLRFGGHPQACGLTIDGEANYEGFKASLLAYAKEQLAGRDLRPTLDIDAEVWMSDVDWKMIEWLERFEPHGEANPRPRFLVRDLLVTSAEVIGKNRNTLRLGVRGNLPREHKIVGFGQAGRAALLTPNSRIDAVLELGTNHWNGTKQIQYKLVDAKPTGADEWEQGS
jgi:single-stranded-DNA-specific exonuclease